MAMNDYNYDDPNYDPYAEDQQQQPTQSYDPAAVTDAAKKESTGFQAPTSPTTAWNRQTFMNGAMSRASGQSVADFVNQGGWGSHVQFVPGSQDKVILPGEQGRAQEVMDLAINSNNGVGGNGWTDAGSWINGQVVPRGQEPGAAPASSAPGVTITASPPQTIVNPQQAANDALRQKLIDQLLQRAGQGLTVDRNNPAIRGQADAYAANEERSKRNYLADMAEKLGPNANLRGETRMASERVGQRTGAFEADLTGRQLTAQREEIAQALESMRGMVSQDQELAMREKLALYDDAIKRLQLQQQGEHFNADLGYRNSALAEQGRQFNNGLGLQYDQFDWDRSPLNPRNILQS